MRDDLVRALRRGGIDARGLNAIHRILLTTDGTVTDMLEAYFQEPMEVVPLAQRLEDSDETDCIRPSSYRSVDTAC